LQRAGLHQAMLSDADEDYPNNQYGQVNALVINVFSQTN
jgi:hypothetical protein